MAAHYLIARSGNEKCALLIIDKITDKNLINSANTSLQMPLHLAKQNGLKTVVEKLISKGALDENGLTPVLASASNTDVAECLPLSLAPTMSFSLFCTMTSLNPVYNKRTIAITCIPIRIQLHYFSLMVDFT
uniref:Uncharacterized protein n=1 Tax=Pyxicephalus adspersus TaxID=30357 RepID=A0AAV3AAJ3_PYXAD|nr:TPA: hypothetical protein GDO54_015862 [Pyxicephalus adspersus]